jgi:ubiquinone/menaquinone biosynthesis C-methylase UbiE
MPRPDLGRPLPYAAYDRRGYATVDVEKGYGAWADVYGELDDRLDIDLFAASPLLERRVPGARIVDLGCGTGRIGRWLAERGAAEVVGVDRTPAMLRHAEARGVYARTHPGDVKQTGLDSGSFDGATTSLVLCHVADLGAFFTEAARLLVPGGFVAIVDFHPFFMMNGVPTHFDDPSSGAPLAIENHVHALSDFFTAATGAGFVVREMAERFVDQAWVDATPNYGKHLGRPVTCFWACERGSG